LYPTLQTTPALSYAIRKLKCIGGLCFTASHNPPQYNGIKVYWEDGAQIIAPQDDGILKEVFSVKNFAETKYISNDEAHKQNLLEMISDDVLNSYFHDIKSLSVIPDRNFKPGAKHNLKIVYTPLHGTGKISALRGLNSWGFHDVFVVPEQGEPNGDFPTVKKPNPEEKEALVLAIDHANRLKADVIFATDPDSDRLAIAVYAPEMAQGLFKHQSFQNYVMLNGNQTGALLIEHILSHMKLNGTLKSCHKIIKIFFFLILCRHELRGR
jgi:phosphoglucomutase